MPRTPSAPAGAAEAAADGVLDGRRDGGAGAPPQTAGGGRHGASVRGVDLGRRDRRDRAGNAPVAELARLDASGLLAITVPRSLGGPELARRRSPR